MDGYVDDDQPATKVTPEHKKRAVFHVQNAIKGDQNSLFVDRFTKAQTDAAHVTTAEPAFPDAPLSSTDMAWANSQQAARGNDGPRVFRPDAQFTAAPRQTAIDDLNYRLHSEYDATDGYNYRKEAGEGEAECDINYAGRAKCADMEQPSTTACCKEYFKDVDCAFCGTKGAAVCAQLPVHLFNETVAKMACRGCEEGVAEDEALHQVHSYAEWVASANEDERNACFKARAVCSGRPCRIMAGMLDEETEAKYFSFGSDAHKHNFNPRHNCLNVVLNSGCTLRKLCVHLRSEGAELEAIDRCMEAAVRDLGKFSYRMRIEQKYFITVGTLLTVHHDQFGLSLDDQSKSDVAATMARVPERIFVARLKAHLLSEEWAGWDLGYNALKKFGDEKSWYWHMKKNIIFGRFWPDALLVAYVEMKVRQWMATGCQFDERGSPRFVLQQQSQVAPLTGFWDGPEAQSAILKPVFSNFNHLISRLNKSNNGQHSDAFKAAKSATGKHAPVWQVMQLVKVIDDDDAYGRANRALFVPTRTTPVSQGKEYAVRDNSIIKKDDLDMLECLHSARLGLLLAEAKHAELERAYPPELRDKAQRARMAIGEYFVEHHLQPLVLVQLAGDRGYALGPKPDIVGASASTHAVVNRARAQTRSSRTTTLRAAAVGLAKKAHHAAWSMSAPKRVNELTRKGMPANLVSVTSLGYQDLHPNLEAHKFNAPGIAMDAVVRALVHITANRGALPTLASHPIDMRELSNDRAIAVEIKARDLSSAHERFNFFCSIRGVSDPANLVIMPMITTDVVLYPGRARGEKDDEWNRRSRNAVLGWLFHVRVMLYAPRLRDPMLQAFCATYTPQLNRALSDLETAFVQFLEPVRLPEPLKQGQIRTCAIDLAEDPNRQLAAKAHWDRNFERAATEGLVEDTAEAKELYFTRDNGHSERCAARQHIITRDPGCTLTHEEIRRRNFANKVFYNQWSRLDKTFRSNAGNVCSVQAKKALCDKYVPKGEELFFKVRPLLKDMARNGEHCDHAAQSWYNQYHAEIRRHSGGAGSRYYQMREDAHNDTSRGGFRGLDAGHCQKASADAILKRGTDDGMRAALRDHFKKAAGLANPGQARQSEPRITPEDVQRYSDAQTAKGDGNDDGGHSDDDDDDADVQGPGDPEAAGQKRPSRRKAKPTSLDQRSKQLKKSARLHDHAAQVLGYKDGPQLHYAALEQGKADGIHPSMLAPAEFSKSFRMYDPKIFSSGDAAGTHQSQMASLEPDSGDDNDEDASEHGAPSDGGSMSCDEDSDGEYEDQSVVQHIEEEAAGPSIFIAAD